MRLTTCKRRPTDEPSLRNFVLWLQCVTILINLFDDIIHLLLDSKLTVQLLSANTSLTELHQLSLVRKFRNDKVLSQKSSNQVGKLACGSSTLNMENINNGESEQSRTRSPPPPQNHNETQRENEYRFNMLQREMSSLKVMMEKLLEQNSEKARQVDS